MTTNTGSSRLNADEVLYNTRSMCPECEELVNGHVISRDGRIYVTRHCAEHGRFDGLICSDRRWYDSLAAFDVEGVLPKNHGAPEEVGCPEDCGLCSKHQQIAGTAAVEISNDCNAKCPACLANNANSFSLEVADVRDALGTLLQSQDRVDTFVLSGGEPTVHPQLFEMIEVLRRPEVDRIVINSNGVRIAQDDAFVDRLAELDNVYICLHFDGPGSKQLRGISHDVQQRALDRLIERKVSVVPLVLAAQGVNAKELGGIVTGLLTRSEAVKSVIISMMTYTGSRGSSFDGDPLERLTIPAALDEIDRGAAGLISRHDFMPLPMPNPLCAAVGYFLAMDDEITPLLRHADMTSVVDYAKNSNLGKVDEGLERLLRDTIDSVYARMDQQEDAAMVLQKLKTLLLKLFPEDGGLESEVRRKIAEENMKTVYLMQFMDGWSFDSKRLQKCSCQHLLPGGKIVPSCGYYAYHRRFDTRFGAASS